MPPAIAAPPKPAAAAPTPAPAAPPPDPKPDTSIPDSVIDDVAAELEGLDPDFKPQRKPAEKPKEGQKPGEKPIEKPKEGETGTKPGEKPKEGEPGEKPPAEPELKGLPAVRKAYDDIKKRVSTELEPEIATLRARVKELEESKPGQDAGFQERLKAAEARRDELENKIAYLDYSKSKDFIDKFEEPITRAWSDAAELIKEISAENDDGTTRPATLDDLVNLANMPHGEARKAANRLFGDSADDVMLHRAEIIKLARAKERALADAEKNAGERAKQNQAQQAERVKATQAAWTGANESLAKKFPNMFGKKEGDEEGNTLLEKGFALADRLFSPSKDTSPKSEQEAVAIHALMRHKIANHDRLALWLKKTRGELKEALEKLKQYEESEPTGGLGGKPSAGGGDNWGTESAMRELESLDKP